MERQLELFHSENPKPFRSPLPHQKEALEYCKRSKIALFMEMRLGKTLVSIRWAKERKAERVLIVAPLSSLNPWEEELVEENVEKKRIHYLLGSREKKLSIAKFPAKGWYLINYEGLRSCPEILKQNWQAIILDESTKIRNPKAQITKLLNSQAVYIPNRCILSGRPNPESALDYFEQFRFLFGSFMGKNNYWNFLHSNFHKGWSGWDWVPNKGTLDRIKNEVHGLSFVRTRSQCGVGSSKVHEKRYVYMTPKQKKLYREIEKTFAFEYGEKKNETQWVVVKYLWMSRLAGGFLPNSENEESNKLTIISEEKTKLLLELLRGELKEEKVVVWFRFNSELKHVKLALENVGIECVSILGETLPSERSFAYSEFRKNPETRVMLAQIKCGKFTYDWSVASTAIYYSNAYDNEDRIQSEDRIIHPKKKEPVLYLDLITKDTVDEDVVKALKEKNLESKLFMNQLISKTLERLRKQAV